MKINWHEYWDKYQNYVAAGVLVMIASACLVFVFTGCGTSVEVRALEQKQADIRNCILSGGHPHAGPNDTILCQ